MTGLAVICCTSVAVENPLQAPVEDARKALDRILASDQFQNAKRSSALLTYLLERVLAGEDAPVKEYTLAVDVFGRDMSFDPRLESLVRVEATRLRKRLKTYYETAGAADPVRIELPPGRYVPVVRSAVIEIEAKPARRSPPRLVHAMLGVAGAVVLTAVIVALSPLSSTPGPALSDLRRLTPQNGFYGYAALWPDGRSVIFSANRGAGNQLKLWRQPLAGDAAAVQITFGSHDDISPSVSPDGKWIAFESGEGGRSIRLMPAAGGPARLITYFGQAPRFSADSTTLLYWVPRPVSGFGKVFRAVLNQPREPEQIVREFDDAHDPVWTPDGKHILFCGTRRTGVPSQEHNFWVAPADGGSAINTGAFALIRQRGIDPHSQILATTGFVFNGESLVFTADAGGIAGLWRLPLSSTTWRASGPVVRLTDETAAAIHPSIRARTIAFTSAAHSIDVWSAPLDATGTAGTLRPETASAPEDLSPSVSASGEVLAFFSGAPLAAELRKKESGREVAVRQVSGFANRLKLSPDGRTAFYRVLEGDGPVKRQAIYATDLKTGNRRLVCADCGSPTSVTADGQIVIFETGHAAARLGLARVANGQKWEFLRHSHHAVQAGRVSPDSRWIAFQLNRGLDGIQIHVAPFHHGAPFAEARWTPVTEFGGVSQEPAWSADGRRLYYLSERDGRRCVWSVSFDPSSGKAGPPREVLPLHDPRLSALTAVRRSPHYIGLSVASNRIVLSLAEISSSIWIAQLRD